MTTTRRYTYEQAKIDAREAFQASLQGKPYHAQELLLRIRNELKHLSGDLPIVGHRQAPEHTTDTPFVTQTFEEAQAWGWLELASGVFQLKKSRPGASMVHFKRAWRIWRPWGMNIADESKRYEARRERLRISLWLGEAWARVISDRAQQVANAVLRAALAELTRIQADDLLEETIQQQRALPPALPGTLIHNSGGQNTPYICSLQ